jgi:hypothetical protein
MVRESRLTDVQGRLDLLVHVCQDIVRDAGTAKWPVNLDRLRMALDEMGALEEPTPGPQMKDAYQYHWDWAAMVSPISDTDGGHDDR